MNAPRCVGVRVMLNMDTQKVATAHWGMQLALQLQLQLQVRLQM